MTARPGLVLGTVLLSLLLTAAPARADWNPFGSYWDNPARAAAQNDAVMVRQIVGTGGNPNDIDESGHTGLHIAAMNGNLQIAAILIKAGAKLDPKDRLGNTPLHYAAERDRVEVVQLLLDLGVPVDPENRNGMTPLMVAASRGNIVVVEALLAKRANPRKADYTGRDAESFAGDSHRPAVVQAIRRAMAGRR